MNIMVVVVIPALIFCIGVSVGIVIHKMMIDRRDYDGSVQTIKDDGKITYVLEVNEDPEKIQYKNELILKVQPLDE